MKNKGIVSLVFDDGYKETYENVLPLLAYFSFKGTFAIAVQQEKIAQSEKISTLPCDVWLEIKKEGHEIASHTVSHEDLATLINAKKIFELEASQKKLQANTLVYPGGSFDEETKIISQRLYQAARTMKKGLNDLPPFDWYELKSYPWLRSTLVLKMNLLSWYAYRKGLWLIESFHLISSREKKYRFCINPLKLRKHLKFLAKYKIPVKTIAEVVKEYKNV